MDTQANYIVFQCYGYERVFHECAYALLSLSRIYADRKLPEHTEIWIYTDNPGWFGTFGNCSLPLYYHTLDNETIKKWRGDIDFVHRVKIELLKDFTRNKKGNVLYLDTDIVFTHPVDPIFAGIGNGELYMHIMEGKVRDRKNPILTKLDNYLTKNNKQIKGVSLREMAMWNAGVLGFNTRYTALLDDVLAFTDAEYRQLPKHIIEQFAFSVYFGMAGQVKAAAPSIFHYWNLKEAGIILSSFFNHFKDKNWEELTRYSSLIQMHGLMQGKTEFLNNRGLVGSLQSKKWAPRIPDWDELAKQL